MHDVLHFFKHRKQIVSLRKSKMFYMVFILHRTNMFSEQCFFLQKFTISYIFFTNKITPLIRIVCAIFFSFFTSIENRIVIK